ncbi:MmcB family DNA repair protein [Elioraea rosea]|uniref:MmcB family DNA repair protein n=1 Tax=Elioraea rosea TaxID=2492390 RepID=UPI001EF4CDF5|nr:MmcB family DNA repair protein [Elioraea rosea]
MLAEARAAERTLAVTQGAARLMGRLGLAVLREVPLADGRRADLLCLAPDGGFTIVEVKSCARDYLTDAKWQDYLAWCDRLYFAVDPAFPHGLIPGEVGLIVADAWDGAVLRDASCHPLAPARRKAVMLRFARLAARRAEAVLDPAGAAAGLSPD